MRRNRFTSRIKKKGAGTTPDNPLTVIIPVAGMGHRMKSYGPKCLLQANQKETIIEKTISNVRKEYPYSDIIVVVGFESEKIVFFCKNGYSAERHGLPKIYAKGDPKLADQGIGWFTLDVLKIWGDLDQPGENRQNFFSNSTYQVNQTVALRISKPHRNGPREIAYKNII